MISEGATLAAAMTDLASGNWRSAADPGPLGWSCLPEIALRALAADTRLVCAAREFTAATLCRWGAGARLDDVAIVVSELLTNALRHGLPRLPELSDVPLRQPIRVGLRQTGPWVLCAVADPSQAVPVPRVPGSLAETGRGLHIIRALSDTWGYTTPDAAGKVVWATFTYR
ncbi:MAG TPA: ATP-binding protein [Streptosporangiaceae bacterium]|nr:ATP-binding protein [Streptosporangiaceae bacterium]